MDIRNSIVELILSHDCVIIPGLGGFIGNYSPARIDPVNHTFHPPAKILLFNTNLKQNDGLLANAVSASMGISYSGACRLIEHFVADCRFNLEAGKTFMLPGVGKFHPGKEGIIFFEQDKNANLLPGSFGLTTFISPPVIRTRQRPVARQLTMPGAPGRKRRPVLRATLRWAAVIALPVGLAATIGFTQFDKFSSNFANTAGMMTAVFSKFSAASLVEKKEAHPTLPLTITVPATPPVAIAAVTPPAPAVQEEEFAIIVGAFRIQENAETLVAELQQKEIKAFIFDQSKGGLYRVAIGTASSRETALQLLVQVKTSDFSGAWILKK